MPDVDDAALTANSRNNMKSSAGLTVPAIGLRVGQWRHPFHKTLPGPYLGQLGFYLGFTWAFLGLYKALGFTWALPGPYLSFTWSPPEP